MARRLSTFECLTEEQIYQRDYRERNRAELCAYRQATKKKLTPAQHARKLETQRTRRQKDPTMKHATEVRSRYWSDPEKGRARERTRRQREKAVDPSKLSEKDRVNNLKRYNITPAQRHAIYLYQGGCCALCRKEIAEFARTTHIDHDHATGTVRGLLCNACNYGMHLPDKVGVDVIAEYILSDIVKILDTAP